MYLMQDPWSDSLQYWPKQAPRVKLWHKTNNVSKLQRETVCATVGFDINIKVYFLYNKEKATDRVELFCEVAVRKEAYYIGRSKFFKGNCATVSVDCNVPQKSGGWAAKASVEVREVGEKKFSPHLTIPSSLFPIPSFHPYKIGVRCVFEVKIDKKLFLLFFSWGT